MDFNSQLKLYFCFLHYYEQTLFALNKTNQFSVVYVHVEESSQEKQIVTNLNRMNEFCWRK